jgi:hypothetical protein
MPDNKTKDQNPESNANANENEKKEKVKQRKVLYEWKSPMRHFKKMDKKKYFMILAIVLGFFVVLVLVKQYWLMAAISAVMFLLYAWGTVPPAELKHVITNEGIESAGTEVEWKNFKGYWFTRKDNQLILNIETDLRLPGRMIMLVSDEEMMRTHQILAPRLKYLDKRKQDKLSKTIDGVWINKLSQEDTKSQENMANESDEQRS